MLWQCRFFAATYATLDAPRYFAVFSLTPHYFDSAIDTPSYYFRQRYFAATLPAHYASSIIYLMLLRH